MFFLIYKEQRLKVDWHQLESLLKSIILSSPDLVPRKFWVIEYNYINCLPPLQKKTASNFNPDLRTRTTCIIYGTYIIYLVVVSKWWVSKTDPQKSVDPKTPKIPTPGPCADFSIPVLSRTALLSSLDLLAETWNIWKGSINRGYTKMVSL